MTKPCTTNLFNIPDGNVMTGQSPAQASVAPSPLRQEPQVPQPSMGAPYTPQQHSQSVQDKQESSAKSNVINNKYPVVKIGRLSVSVLCSNFILQFLCHLSTNIQIYVIKIYN